MESTSTESCGREHTQNKHSWANLNPLYKPHWHPWWKLLKHYWNPFLMSYGILFFQRTMKVIFFRFICKYLVLNVSLMNYYKGIRASQPHGTNLILCLILWDFRWKSCYMEIRTFDLIWECIFLATHPFSAYMWRIALPLYLSFKI